MAINTTMEHDNASAILDDAMDTDDSAVTDQVDQVVSVAGVLAGLKLISQVIPPPVAPKQAKRRASSTTKKTRRKSTSARPASVRPTVRPAPAGTEDGCQTCNVPYSQDDGLKGSWIGCDGCKAWHHARCVELDQSQVDKIDKFYCRKCEPVFGKSTCRFWWMLEMTLANIF